MSSAATVSGQDLPRIYSLPLAQDPVPIELVRATCHENAFLRHEKSRLDEAIVLERDKSRQLEQELGWWRREWIDVMEENKKPQAAANNIHIQLRQQAALMASIKGQNTDILRQCEEAEGALKAERDRNAQSVQIFSALSFLQEEELENLLGNRVDFHDVLANYPPIMDQVIEREKSFAEKQKLLESLHSQLDEELGD